MTSEQYKAVSRKLVKKFTDIISGYSEDYLFGKKPSEIVMLGMIKANDPDAIISGNEDSRYESAPSIGAVVRVSKNQNTLFFKPNGKLYYRALPSYEENCKFLIDK